MLDVSRFVLSAHSHAPRTVEGVNAIAQGRMLLGATNPKDSLPGTIRGDLCVDVGRNICHGSDGPDSAKKEIEFWFKEEEICSYTSHSHQWVYEKGAAVRPAAAAGGGGKKEATPSKKEAAPANNSKGGKKSSKKKGKGGKQEPKAFEFDEKRKKAAYKEGGKKGQDLAGMASFGSMFHLTSFKEPNGEMEYLKLCMQGANAEVDPDAEDRKGGAGDIGKIFISAGDANLAVIAHVPKERPELTVDEYFAPVLAKLGNPKVIKIDEFTRSAEVKADPDKDLFPIKLHDAALSAGFDFLREKKLILDDDSDDDINFADACGIDLNAGADGSDY